MMGSVVRTPGSHTTAAMASTRAIVATGPAALSPLKAAINRTGLRRQQLLGLKALVRGSGCLLWLFLDLDSWSPLVKQVSLLLEALCRSLSKIRVRYAEGKIADYLSCTSGCKKPKAVVEAFWCTSQSHSSVARNQEMLPQNFHYLSHLQGVQTLPLSPNRIVADATLHSDSSRSNPDIHALLVM